jgi:UDP-N-acetylmuramoyl-tripeptide--D-alanyl-D-alanine ligase
MSADAIASSFAAAAPPPQRGEVLRFADEFTVINDSYNSNPDALVAMIETLVEGSSIGSRRVVVAGEMLELGSNEKELHRAVGTAIAGSGIDRLIGVRGLARDLVDAAREAGLADAEFAADSNEAAEIVAGTTRPGDVILVKGSRGVRTERVIEKLLEQFQLVQEEQELKA